MEPTCLWSLELIVPSVSKHDEAKSNGHGMALIESLVLVGFLIKDEKNGQECWKACSNHKERQVHLCLDGLSLDRHQNFFKKLADLPISFSDSLE